MPNTILVVDKNDGIRELLEEFLAGQGLRVVSAPEGLPSLGEIARLKPDLILIDVDEAILNSGFEICRRIKTNPETQLIPVVLMTGLSETADRVRGIEAGADGFLSKPFNLSELLAHVHSLLRQKACTDELERAEPVLLALARSIEAKDPYTQGHCERLSDSAARLGQHIGLQEDEIVALRRAGIVHDIGKVAVPDAILLKPGPLTPDEMRIMQQHPAVGAGICAPLKCFGLVLPVIRHHHEKLNGTGYPDGLLGGHIPIMARVLQVVDVYDALTTIRPYKQAFSPVDSLAIMAEEVRRGWWDKGIFEAFCRMPLLAPVRLQSRIVGLHKGPRAVHEPGSDRIRQAAPLQALGRLA